MKPLQCAMCESTNVVLERKSQYRAFIECHECWAYYSIGIDPCYKEFTEERPQEEARK